MNIGEMNELRILRFTSVGAYLGKDDNDFDEEEVTDQLDEVEENQDLEDSEEAD